MDEFRIVSLNLTRNKKEVFAVFDNNSHLKIPLDLALSNKLKKGKLISTEDYNKLQQEIRIFEAQRIAYSKATSSLKSRYQLKKILLIKGYNDEEIEIVLDKLDNLKVIDDEKFARIAYEYLATKKFYGDLKIQNYLRSRGIPKMIIDKVVSELSQQIDQSEQIEKVYENNINKIKRKTPKNRIQYCYRMFKSYGYPTSVIKEFLRSYRKFIVEL